MNTLTLADRLRGLRVLVGNTPLLAVEFSVDHGPSRRLYAKAESLNLTGSIKDRMALHILRQRARGGRAAARRADRRSHQWQHRHLLLRHRPRPRPPGDDLHARLDERRAKALIRSPSAQPIRLVSKEEGGFLGSIALAEALAESTPGAFLPRQFANETKS